MAKSKCHRGTLDPAQAIGLTRRGGGSHLRLRGILATNDQDCQDWKKPYQLGQACMDSQLTSGRRRNGSRMSGASEAEADR